MLNNIALSERADHERRMFELPQVLAELRGDRSVAAILFQINETSLQGDEKDHSRDWLNGLLSGRKSVDLWELRALARGLVPSLPDKKEVARRRAQVYRRLVELAFPLDWDGSDAV